MGWRPRRAGEVREVAARGGVDGRDARVDVDVHETIGCGAGDVAAEVRGAGDVGRPGALGPRLGSWTTGRAACAPWRDASTAKSAANTNATRARPRIVAGATRVECDRAPGERVTSKWHRWKSCQRREPRQRAVHVVHEAG